MAGIKGVVFHAGGRSTRQAGKDSCCLLGCRGQWQLREEDSAAAAGSAGMLCMAVPWHGMGLFCFKGACCGWWAGRSCWTGSSTGFWLNTDVQWQQTRAVAVSFAVSFLGMQERYRL